MALQRSNWTGIAFGLCLAYLAAYQQFKLPPVLPVLLDTYRYDRTLAGGFMSVYAVAGLLLSWLLGRTLMATGLARPTLGALGLMVLGSGLCMAMPQNDWVVLAGRGLEGAGFAVLAIVGPVLANGNAAVRHLPIVIGLTASWIPVGQLAATALAPLAFATTGWTLLWTVAIAASLAMAAWTVRLGARGALDLSVGGSAPPTDAPAHAPFDARQRRGLALAGGVFMLWSGQYFAYMTWLPQYLVEVHGASVNQALAGYSLPVATLILFCLVTGALLRLGVPLALLLPLALASQAAVWWLIPVTGGGWPGLASLVGYGIGAGITPTCLFAMPSAILGQGRAVATAFAYIMTGRSVGVFLGPILLAEAFKSVGSWDVAVPIFGVVTSAALAAGVLLALRLRTLRSTASA
jgi:hypothetical protein